MVSLHKPNHTSFDLHKSCLMAIRNNDIHNGSVVGLVKTDHLLALRSFGPTQRGPTLETLKCLGEAGIKFYRIL